MEALKVSSDTYFFEVGERANSHGNVIQRDGAQARDRPADGDRPAERDRGRRARRARGATRQNALELRCERRRHVATCGIVDEVRPWSVGDNMHLAVGQGDLLTDPLQMAVAYSTLANAYMNGGEGRS